MGEEWDLFEDADTFFRKTLELGPNLIEAYFQLGRAQWFAEDQEGAKASWNAGFQANKFNPWGKKCRDVLALVESGGQPPAPGEADANAAYETVCTAGHERNAPCRLRSR